MNNTTTVEAIDDSCHGIVTGFLIGGCIYLIILVIIIIFACAQNWNLMRTGRDKDAMLARITALENLVSYSTQKGGVEWFDIENRHESTAGGSDQEIPSTRNWHVEILQPHPYNSNYAQLKTFQVQTEGE